MTNSTSPVSEGDVLAGKYVVEKVLGQGGMGVVVSARHTQLGSRVALKFVLDDFARDPHAIARFMREAQSATRITSEHVARVLDVGQLESGAPYMVMEYLEGSDLAKVVESRGPLPLEEVIDYVTQACRALAEAHGKGVIHRDIKPSNLFLTRRFDGSALVKVLDFGIAKMIAADVPGELTQTQSMMGSPLYASPEQLDSARHASERSDIWALGVTLHHLASGGHPFMAESQAKLIASIMMGKPTPVREHRRDLPEDFERIVLRCVERDPSRRFQSVNELVAALGQVVPGAAQRPVVAAPRALEGTAVLADPTPVFARSAPGRTTMPHVADLSSTEPRGRGRGLVFGATALGAALAVAVVVRLATSGGPAPVDSTASVHTAPSNATPRPSTASTVAAPATATAAEPEPAAVTVTPAQPAETEAAPAPAPMATAAPAASAVAAKVPAPGPKKTGAKAPGAKGQAAPSATPRPGATPPAAAAPKDVGSLIDERR